MTNLQKERVERMLNKFAKECKILSGTSQERDSWIKLETMAMAVRLLGYDYREDKDGHYHIIIEEAEQ